MTRSSGGPNRNPPLPAEESADSVFTKTHSRRPGACPEEIAAALVA